MSEPSSNPGADLGAGPNAGKTTNVDRVKPPVQ